MSRAVSSARAFALVRSADAVGVASGALLGAALAGLGRLRGIYLLDMGCLLALVREAWRCPTVYVRQGTTRRVSDGAFAWEVCDLWLDAEACRALGVDRLFGGKGGQGSRGPQASAETKTKEAAHHA